MLEKKLNKLFVELGADIKATDLARVLRVPGAKFEEKATATREHCLKYRGVGFPEANEIIEYGDELIVVWKYVSSDKLPGRALSRWKRTQEDLCEYFEVMESRRNITQNMCIAASRFIS